jgi:hypothetical protein
MSATVNFVRQQGFSRASTDSCGYQYPALMWQPRVMGVLVLIGLAWQSWQYFLALAVLLWWNVLVPRLNPFDAIYNAFAADDAAGSRLEPAPAPRRFSQGMAGTFMLLIAVSLYMRWPAAALTFEILVAIALAALIFGRFCLGSYLYLLLTGNGAFANRTLPWSREA